MWAVRRFASSLLTHVALPNSVCFEGLADVVRCWRCIDEQHVLWEVLLVRLTAQDGRRRYDDLRSTAALVENAGVHRVGPFSLTATRAQMATVANTACRRLRANSSACSHQCWGSLSWCHCVSVEVCAQREIGRGSGKRLQWALGFAPLALPRIRVTAASEYTKSEIDC